MTLRVALIDDHQTFRERMRALLEKDPDIEIVAEAASGEEFLEIALTTAMDVACMDISMPGMNGIEATRRLLALRPGVRVIGLSAYADPLYVNAMLQVGAVGYFTKGDADATLLQAVLTATVEHPSFGASVSLPDAANASAEGMTDQSSDDGDSVSFGAKELEVLRLIAQRYATPQIGQSLTMEPAMVDAYRRNIMRKLHLDTDAELSEYALRRGCAG
jgi:DNA-binding NarL/FixJ family response regulator